MDVLGPKAHLAGQDRIADAQGFNQRNATVFIFFHPTNIHFSKMKAMKSENSISRSEEHITTVVL